MKRISVNLLLITAFALLLFAFVTIKDGGIKGKVSSADSVVQVIAISGSDTLKANINGENFTISNVKPGTYVVWIKGKFPSRDASLINVPVLDSTTTDVGQIRLKQ